MDNRKEKDGWMSVPQFGGWEHKAGGAVDYSMVFTRARENRKQIKTDVNRASIGNEEELMTHHRHDGSPMRKKILSYFNCCIKA
ncbi:hypothetical protein AMTRI_Chr01g103750 [Amborella trichopoda]|uniref:uncharacterized protein LOC105420033 n=1 Tax=Amborella trichopoda TaxID=13333 RepID=UPI0005D45D34|nr:uncharacterized protein LOC105420033 [Amborella trichopoda]|eukprot:XP_011620392.1 uncharacterized protein LOC105420033 [Amborella trichopoda]